MAAIAAVAVTVLVIVLVLSTSLRKISITNGDVKYHETQGKYVVVYFDDEGVASYQIEYKTAPKRLSENVKFEYNETEGVSVSEDGLVTFTSAIYAEGTVHSIRVALVSEKGSDDVRDEILIIAKYKK